MAEFPASWVLLPVSDVVRNVTLTDKKIPQKSYLPSGKFPVFDQGQEYVGGYTDDAAMLVDCDLPVIVFGDHTRTVKLVNAPFAPGADGVKVLQPSACILPKLLENFVRYLVTKIPNNGYARHYQHLAKSLLPIPPLAEQHRIVAKIEELFSELDQGVASLKTAREQLKVYRQSLLKNAFEGKLTATWRAAHSDQLETAAALQQRIARERQARYKQQLADWQTAGQAGPKPKSPKPLPPLTAEELAELPELPAGWGWARLGSVMETTVGFAFKSAEFVSTGGVRLLRGDNIEPGRLRWADARYWPLERANEFTELMLAAGEIIIAMDRPVISSGLKVARVRQTDLPCLLVQRVARIKEQPGICTDFAYASINQNRFVNHCLGHQTGTQLPHISEAQIRSYPIPLCSLAEQEQISAELDAKLSEADQLDQTLATALQQADALRQSILKKAFHGQLVKQDKNEEPATALLERIRAEKFNGINKPGKRGKPG